MEFISKFTPSNPPLLLLSSLSFSISLSNSLSFFLSRSLILLPSHSFLFCFPFSFSPKKALKTVSYDFRDRLLLFTYVVRSFSLMFDSFKGQGVYLAGKLSISQQSRVQGRVRFFFFLLHTFGVSVGICLNRQGIPSALVTFFSTQVCPQSKEIEKLVSMQNQKLSSNGTYLRYFLRHNLYGEKRQLSLGEATKPVLKKKITLNGRVLTNSIETFFRIKNLNKAKLHAKKLRLVNTFPTGTSAASFIFIIHFLNTKTRIFVAFSTFKRWHFGFFFLSPRGSNISGYFKIEK